MARVRVGLEHLSDAPWRRRITGVRIGLVAHPASVTSRLVHALDVLEALGARVEVLFGPEHGFGGEAQDMEPVSTGAVGPHGIPLHSLYGATAETLSPRDEQLAGIDALVVDLADVGARYYTFVWTAVLCLRRCHARGIRCLILDRPNPLGGLAVEGAPQEPGCLSFVGLCPVAVRHGLTVGELVALVAAREGLSDALEVVPLTGWRRGDWYDATGLPFVLPSPNMPTLDTATVYPGACLLEATTLSEGRGTTRPFELLGAPEIDGGALARRLAAMDLPGVVFRPTRFKPGFQKHAGRSCGGVQLHVTDRERFRPFRTGIALLLAARAELGGRFAWREQPYEFVQDVPAIDLLTGSPRFRLGIEAGAGLAELFADHDARLAPFLEERAGHLRHQP